ncbi:MAG: DUF4270 domain-containing protein [Capnocytophaga sp.]|nr:DUF4270 domain-containing protein [Capnocytophaga sp.]
MSKKRNFWTLMAIGAVTFLHSCTDDSFKNIESDLIGDTNYETGIYNASVRINNIEESSIRSNGLSGYLLGQYTQTPFGTKNAKILTQVMLPSVSPAFGANSQSTEDTNNEQENETAKEVYLYIPFYSTSASSVNANNEAVTTYTLDSIYGNTQSTFDIRVYESNYFLRDIDPADNFNSAQIYYSDLDVSGHLGTKLAEISNYSISPNSITRYNFDNPTTDTDESTTELDVLAPGIRIPLDVAFFQSKILDKEGSSELAVSNAFLNYFRGLYIETDNFSDNLMMLLNLNSAKIEIVYSYDTTSNETDYTMTSRYEMNIANSVTTTTTSGNVTTYTGIRVNLFEKTNDVITSSTSGDADRIYIGGSLGRLAEFNLFTDAELSELKQNNALINDATLTLYIDQSAGIAKNPERLYIYNAETGEPLIDYSNDVSANTSRLIHLGKLVKENGSGAYYQIRLTNHVTNIIRRDSTNVKLGLAVASNVNSIAPINYYDKADATRKPTSITTIYTPLSTILYGNTSSVDEAKRLKLTINYSKLK